MKRIINDVCDVMFKRLTDDKIIFTAEAQLSSVQQAIKEDKIKGGIGNRDIAILRSEKTVTLKVRNAVYDTAWLEMVAGVEFADATACTIFRTEKGLVLTGGKVTITNDPVDDKVTLIDSQGKKFTGTFDGVSKEVTIVGGLDGAIYTALYDFDTTGSVLSIDATKFPENYYVEYQTIEYDIDTNEIVNELIWQFDKVTPNANFEMQFQNGTAISPEFDFTCLAPAGTNQIGRVIEIAYV